MQTRGDCKHNNVIAKVTQATKTYVLWKITLNLSIFNCCTQRAGNSCYRSGVIKWWVFVMSCSLSCAALMGLIVAKL